MSSSRRTFLTSATLALPAANVLAANETINIGLIGTGGRCRFLMNALAKVPNTRMTAVCDVYEPNVDLARKIADPKATATKEFRELLNDKSIDAVLIATPDHWHAPMTLEAMAAGKDVYVEKPLTHKLAEGESLLNAARKSKAIVQVGTQQRSMPHIQKALELVREGRIGTIHKVHLSWNRNSDRVRRGPQNIDARKLDWQRFLGNAPKQDFDEYRYRNWRWFWDFGNGILTDLMVHWVDVAHWFLGDAEPQRAVSMGSQVTSEGVWETPDTIQTLLTYPKNVQLYFEGTFCNSNRGAMILFMGSEANLYIDRGRFEITPELRSKNQKGDEMILGTGPRGRDFYDRPDGELLHLTNWIDCIRTRREPTAPIAAGVSAAAAAHLGNIAYRENRVAVARK